jgi:hypothetical protein
LSFGDFYIKFTLRNKVDGFRWVLVAVYGAAQPEYKESFLTELVHSCSIEKLPMLVGGDFNIIRNPSEKNNDNFDGRYPFLFNATINTVDLRLFKLSGRKFTWANDRQIPTCE